MYNPIQLFKKKVTVQRDREGVSVARVSGIEEVNGNIYILLISGDWAGTMRIRHHEKELWFCRDGVLATVKLITK